MIQYRCPACAREYQTDGLLAGLTVICLGCKHPIEIPSAKKSPQDDIIAGLPTPTIAPLPPEKTQYRIGASIVGGLPPTPLAPAPVAADVQLTPEGLARIRLQDSGMRRVAVGLLLCFVAVVVHIVAVVYVWAGIFHIVPDRESLLLAVDLLRIGRWIALVAVLVEFVGWWCCLVVPEETGAHNYIYVAVLLNLIVLLAGVFELISAFGWIGLSLPGWLNVVLRIMQGVAHLAFLLFLHRLAGIVEQSWAESATSLMIVVGVVMVLLQAFTCLLIVWPIAVAVGLGELVWLGAYAVVLGKLWNGVRQRLIPRA